MQPPLCLAAPEWAELATTLVSCPTKVSLLILPDDRGARWKAKDEKRFINGKRAFHHDLLVNSVLKQNIVDAETRSLMSKFGELFIVRAEPRGGEDREFGGAMTPELSGAFDI